MAVMAASAPAAKRPVWLVGWGVGVFLGVWVWVGVFFWGVWGGVLLLFFGGGVVCCLFFWVGGWENVVGGFRGVDLAFERRALKSAHTHRHRQHTRIHVYDKQTHARTLQPHEAGVQFFGRLMQPGRGGGERGGGLERFGGGRGGGGVYPGAEGFEDAVLFVNVCVCIYIICIYI